MLGYNPPMCPKCEGFAERMNPVSRREYLDIVRQLIQIVSEETFLLVRADCPLEEMLETPMPRDCVHHDFQCTTCGRAFQLFADTYHGRAGWIPDHLVCGLMVDRDFTTSILWAGCVSWICPST